MTSQLFLRGPRNASKVTGTRASFPDNATPGGMCSACTLCGLCEIGKKAKTGRALFPEPFGTSQFGAEKIAPHVEDLQIIPELFGEGVLFARVSTETALGGFKASLPLSIAAMGSTRVAHTLGTELAQGAALSGIPCVIGENVLGSHGEQGLKNRIKPFLDSYDGKNGAIIVQGNLEDEKQGTFEKAVSYGAMGIELKFGQGAKQGLGGEIKFQSEGEAEKYRKLGYYVVKDKEGFERHSIPGGLSRELLLQKLEKYSSLKVPIWIKIAMGRGIMDFVSMLKEFKEKKRMPVECLTIDGLGGGTGMSPWLIMNETCIPSAGIFSVLKEKLPFTLLLAGGYNTGIDTAKVMMLGANGCAMGRAPLVAAKVARAEGVKNLAMALREDLQMVCATQRLSKADSLVGRKTHLLALSDDAANMFGVSRSLSEKL